VPTQSHSSSLSAQVGASRGEIGFADAPEARPLTPYLAQKQLSNGFKASEVWPEATPSALARAPHEQARELLDYGAIHGWNVPYGAERITELFRGAIGMSRKLVVASMMTPSSYLLFLYITSAFADHASPWSFAQVVIPNETHGAVVLAMWAAINVALATSFVRLTIGKRS
jgi:hypothetical protein